MSTSQKPYYSTDGKPVLQRSIVVQADILGYKCRLERAHREGREQAELLLLHDAIAEAYLEIRDPSGSKWTVKSFSDNLMIGYPWLGTGGGVFEFDQACFNIAHFQLALATRGILIRGGIAVGEIHIGDHFIFGWVLNEMIATENTTRNPCIYLTESAKNYEKSSQHHSPDDTLAALLWSHGEVIFINYLLPLGSMRDSLREAMVEKHRDMITANLQVFQGRAGEHDDEVFKKYIWLANYHNTFCKSSKYWRDQQYLVRDSAWSVHD